MGTTSSCLIKRESERERLFLKLRFLESFQKSIWYSSFRKERDSWREEGGGYTVQQQPAIQSWRVRPVVEIEIDCGGKVIRNKKRLREIRYSGCETEGEPLLNGWFLFFSDFPGLVIRIFSSPSDSFLMIKRRLVVVNPMISSDPVGCYLGGTG